MQLYEIRIKKSAEKELASLPLDFILAIKVVIEKLAFDPLPKGSKKLKGFINLYRIRKGKYRIIYSIHENILLIEVLKIGKRDSIYN